MDPRSLRHDEAISLVRYRRILRGGTFTDCVGNPGTGRIEDDVVIKLLSEDPANYDDAPLEGIRRLLSKFSGREIPRGKPLDTSQIESIRTGTTVATNAPLERKGEKIALVLTKGFKDCLKIGNQSRPKIFDLAIKRPDVLYRRVIEIDERVTLEDYAEDPSRYASKTLPHDQTPPGAEIVRALSSEAVRILQRPSEQNVKLQLRYGSGRYEHVFETTTAGVTIQSPQLDINTVAAGGGSRLFFRNGLFVVGPESAGAHPGPACYRKGGPLTVTDANLFLGRLLPDFFSKIFGENENEGLDEQASRKLFEDLTREINNEIAQGQKEKEMTRDEVAYGFIKIANETMTRPIRSLTEAKGHDTSKHRLATFGGAGGQHAVAIAESWDPPDSVKQELKSKMNELKKRSTTKLRDQGFDDKSIVFEEYLNMRHRGTESALMIIKPSPEEAKDAYGGDDWAFGKAFVKQHEQEFGFTLPDRDITVDDVRVRGIGKSFEALGKTVDQQLKEARPRDVTSDKQYGTSQVYFEGGRRETPIYKLDDLKVNDRVKGPAILADGTQTLVVTPGSTALILETHMVINIGEAQIQEAKTSTSVVDPIMLSIFAHRFMAIAEQMGRALQKTSTSVNVKERLDYSCALFDSEGGLVANAPRLPVHSGSMSTCVRMQARIWKGKLKPGDVIVSNHPEFGARISLI
ncbi:hypothetical protein VTN00DRAFT_2482 [Thermoascus crustaceus]|uniref:uncharacterized protein n=1 Tax=Thermoascus crustaceus TaxID=5088 RepID=UPI0037435932